MQFMTIDRWAEKYFSEDSRPPEATMRRWMQTGAVPARKIGGSWYVEVHAWLAAGNPLVERVLCGD